MLFRGARSRLGLVCHVGMLPMMACVIGMVVGEAVAGTLAVVSRRLAAGADACGRVTSLALSFVCLLISSSSAAVTVGLSVLDGRW